MSINAGTVMAYMDMDMSKYNNALQLAMAQATAFAEEGSGLSGMIDGMGAGLTTVGRALTMGVTVPLVGIGVAAVNTGLKFDESMSYVAALSGATGDKFDELRAKALEMGSQTKYTASQAADAMGYMALAGWNADQMIAGLPGVLNLAAAANMDLARASDIVTDTMTPFGLAAAEAGRVSDVFAKAQATSNTTVELLGEAMKYAAPNADAFGMSIEQASAVLGFFANTGLKGSMAGTTFTSMLTDMKNAAVDGAIAIGKSSISLADANGNYRDIVDIVRDVETATYGMSESERDAALSAVFQTRGMKGILALLKQGSDALEDYTEDLENADGAAEDMAETMQDNLKGDLTILKSGIEGAAIALSDYLVPWLRKGVQWITSAVSWFNNMDQGMKNMIFRIGVIAAAIGPALLIGGKLISAFSGVIPVLGLLAGGFALVYNHSERLQNFVQRTKDNLPVWMDGAKTAYESFRTALASGQGVLSAAETALEAAFGPRAALNIGRALRAVQSGFRAAKGYVTDVADGIGEFLGSLIDGEGAAEALRQGLEAAFGQEFALRASGVITRIDTAFQGVRDTALSFASGMRLTFTDLWTGMEADYEAGGLAAMLRGLGTRLGELLSSGADAVKAGASLLLENIKSGLTISSDWLKNMILGDAVNEGTWTDVGAQILSWVQAGFAVSGDWIKGLVLGDTYTPDSTWKDAGASIWTTIQSGITVSGDWIKGLVLGDTYTPDSTWKDAGASIWTTIQSGITATGDWIKGLVLSDTYTPDSSWSDVGTSIWTTIKSGITATGDWIKGLVLGDTYTPDSSWSGVGTSIWTTIKSGITATGDWIKGLVLGDTYTPDSSWSDVGIAILDKIQWAQETLTEKAGEWLNNLGTAMGSDEAKAKITEITSVAAAIAGKIVSGIGTWKTTAATLISDLITQLTDSGFLETAVTGLGNIVLAIATGIGNAAENITGCAATLIGKLSDKFVEEGFIESVFTTAADIVLSIAGALASAAGNIVSAATDIATALLDGLAGLDWATIFSEAGNVVSAIAKVLADNAGKIGTAALDLGLKLLEGLAQVDWATISYNLSVALGNLVTSISDWFANAENQQKLLDVGGEIAGGIAKGLWQSFVEDVKAGWENDPILNAIRDLFGNASEEEKAARAYATNLTQAFYDQFKTGIQELVDPTQEQLAIALGLQTGGIDLFGINQGLYDRIIEPYLDMIDGDLKKGFQGIGFTISDEFAAAIAGGQITAEEALYALSLGLTEQMILSMDRLSLQEYLLNPTVTVDPTVDVSETTQSVPVEIDPTVTVDETAITTATQSAIDSASSTLTSGETTVGTAAQGVADAALAPFEGLPEETKAQAALMLTAVNEAIEEGTPEATAAIETAASAVFDQAAAILNGPAGTAIGSSFLIGIMTGALSIQGALTATLQGIGNMGRSAFASIMSTGAGYSIGQSMIQAVISGAGSMAGALSSRMYSLASSAVSAFKSAIRMASPPKAFTEIGEAIPDAVGLGAEGNRDAAINPIAELAQDLQRAFAVSLDDASVTHNAHTVNAGGGQSSGGGSGFVFHFHGDMTVRDDADIERISRQIYDDIQDVIRGGGALA